MEILVHLLGPLMLLAALGAWLLYDRLICRPRCWRHGHRPDFAAIPEPVWKAYFHALPNILETLRRRGFPSPFAETLCAWRLDRFEKQAAAAVTEALGQDLGAEEFRRCHRVVAYLARFAFPHRLHHTACITRLRQAMAQDRVASVRRTQAREALVEHERRLGVLEQVERRFGPPLPRDTAEYFYGLMLRWEALYEEHGYTLHPALEAWRRERTDLGV